MPNVSRWFIKTGLVCFAIALVLGGLRLLTHLGVESMWLTASAPAHIHLFVFGWITEMIIGVAVWLFPIVDRDNPRGRVWLLWLAYGTINAGLAARVVAEPWASATGGTSIWDWTLFVSAILQAVGGLAFTINIWPRVKKR